MDTKEEIIRQFEAQTAPLSPETHEKLANILVRFELAKGDLFLREGEICKYYSMVARGMIRLFSILSRTINYKILCGRITRWNTCIAKCWKTP